MCHLEFPPRLGLLTIYTIPLLHLPLLFGLLCGKLLRVLMVCRRIGTAPSLCAILISVLLPASWNLITCREPLLNLESVVILVVTVLCSRCPLGVPMQEFGAVVLLL